MNKPSIDVVIPVFNGVEHIDAVLDRIAGQVIELGGRAIVVNDGSTDGTGALLDGRAADWLKVVHQDNLGRAAARNTGLSHCLADVVVFLDADILVDASTWLRAHLEAQRKQPAVYMGAIRQDHEASPTVTARSQSAVQSAKGPADADFEGDALIGLCSAFRKWARGDRVSWVCVTGANVSMPRKVVVEIGGFDQRFFGWGPEDLELSYRLKLAGLATFALSGAASVHLKPRYEEHYDRDRIFQHLSYFYGKHPFSEVRAYVRYVTGQLSMQELFSVTTGEPKPLGDYYFRPRHYFAPARAQHNGSQHNGFGQRSIVEQALLRVEDMRRPEVVRLPVGGPVMLFAPHPDDEVLGAGGTLRKHVEAGHTVTIVFVTDGRRGRRRSADAAATITRRRAEAEAAASVLGVQATAFLDAADYEFIPEGELVLRTRNLILQHRPQAIYLPGCGEQHRDHLLTSVLVMEALKGVEFPVDIVAYEVWTPLQPTCVVDITQQMAVKLKALRCHASQLELSDYTTGAQALSAYRASLLPLASSQYAEAFRRADYRQYLEHLNSYLFGGGAEFAGPVEEAKQ